MKSFGIIFLLASAAYAQDSLIPSGISQACSSFLTTLDSDSSLLGWTQALVEATTQFGPGGNSSDVSSSSVNAALNSLCSASSSCPQDVLRSKLAAFYAACPTELTSNPNTDILLIYDVLYALLPLTQAVCSKADSGRYCVVELGSGDSTSSSASPPNNVDLEELLDELSVSSASGVARRDSSIYPNATTFQTNNIPFLLLKASLSSGSLCGTCTRSALTPYINIETEIPHAAGISQSPLLSGQLALYQAVTTTCGAAFLVGSVQAAGGITGSIAGGAPANVVVNLNVLTIGLLAVVAGYYATL